MAPGCSDDDESEMMINRGLKRPKVTIYGISCLSEWNNDAMRDTQVPSCMGVGYLQNLSDTLLLIGGDWIIAFENLPTFFI